MTDHSAPSSSPEGPTISSLYDPQQRLLMVGEHHGSVEAKEEMAQSMDELARKGITDLALEAPRDLQLMVDLCQKKEGRDEGFQAVARFIYLEKMNAFPGVAESYANILIEAHRANIRIHCIDMDSALQWERPMSGAGVKHYRQAREKLNADLLTDLLERTEPGETEPKRRVVWYGGISHIEPKELENQFGLWREMEFRLYQPQAVLLYGGIKPTEEPGPREQLHMPVEIAARTAGHAMDRYLFSADRENNKFHLHLPQRGGVAMEAYTQIVRERRNPLERERLWTEAEETLRQLTREYQRKTPTDPIIRPAGVIQLTDLRRGGPVSPGNQPGQVLDK